jgi:acylaminoacyl-peptidase
MPTSFVPSYAYLSLSLGAAIVHVNYRGSTGFGQASIDSLCGTIGTNDVSDMMTALTDTLAAYPDMLDADKVCVVGGSHGGFLAGHLIGQHPDTFCAAALRNPVTNIPAMAGVTDIPDWCFVETLGPGASSYDFQRHNPANADVLAKMFACSPVAHIDKVRTPALLCIGAVDRRVPQSQGIEYYSLLKSRGVPSRMLLFPEDCHAIDKPCSEAEHFVAIAEWFQKYINK